MGDYAHIVQVNIRAIVTQRNERKRLIFFLFHLIISVFNWLIHLLLNLRRTRPIFFEKKFCVVSLPSIEWSLIFVHSCRLLFMRNFFSHVYKFHFSYYSFTYGIHYGWIVELILLVRFLLKIAALKLLTRNSLTFPILTLAISGKIGQHLECAHAAAGALDVTPLFKVPWKVTGVLLLLINFFQLLPFILLHCTDTERRRNLHVMGQLTTLLSNFLIELIHGW